VIRRRLLVTGHVQGVFYRDWFVERATASGVDGWVRNRADGSVEAVVQGPAGAVERMIDLARQGSPASRVDAVAVHDDPAAEVPKGFTRRPTA